ncbi:heme-degrading domain-containing protein [Agromyces atrinae]|uniref:Heme-degrading domain-containing protein n=1 Tax=Agromyces atrinae TaxID=592376 RepID=A0A4Q2M290_9MICO|nr:heme-degrading domain-containing protein [Agromyces atrinae]NYD68663.1 uncharacterized protein (UPF0303 family) [Agromyces atrinae]RXZ86034.1 heme-degrading domain-containing protein [Agromyces atrinae]
MTAFSTLTDLELIPVIEEQNSRLSFTSFDHDDAVALGNALVARAAADDLSFTTSILFGAQRVFHAARPGTNADNDDWLAKKARVVARFDAPSLLVGARCRAAGIDFHEVFGLDRSQFIPAGGGFPLRVNGSLTGFVGVSGLPERDDHSIVVEALEAAIARHS